MRRCAGLSDQTRPPHVVPATPSRFDASERPSLRLFSYDNRRRAFIIHPLSSPSLSALDSGVLDKALCEEEAGDVVDDLEEGARPDAYKERAPGLACLAFVDGPPDKAQGLRDDVLGDGCIGKERGGLCDRPLVVTVRAVGARPEQPTEGATASDGTDCAAKGSAGWLRSVAMRKRTGYTKPDPAWSAGI